MKTNPFNSEVRRRSGTRRLAAGLAITGALLVPAAALADQFKGTDGNDTITGTEGQDVIHARAGEDVVKALAGLDRVHAGSGNDSVEGGEDHDLIRGGDGDDDLEGGAGPRPHLRRSGCGQGRRRGRRRQAVGVRAPGGAGDDRFHTRDGEKDTVDCGDGRDRVLADYRDEVMSNCDRVIRRPANRRERAEGLDERTKRLDERGERLRERADRLDRRAERVERRAERLRERMQERSPAAA